MRLDDHVQTSSHPQLRSRPVLPRRRVPGLLASRPHWFFDPLRKVRVDVVSQREPWLVHEKLDVIVKSGALAGRAVVVDLKDHERALVWIDGRFSHVLPPGLYAYWTGVRRTCASKSSTRGKVRFEHDDFKRDRRGRAMPPQVLDVCTVERDHVGVLFLDGEYVETLPPGQYAFWKRHGRRRRWSRSTCARRRSTSAVRKS